MAKKKVKKLGNKEDKKLLAFVTTFLSIIGFVLALIFWRNDKYVMHYAEQSMVVFIYSLIAGILSGLLGRLPIIGMIISSALSISVLVLWVISWVFAFSGEEKDVPLIGEFGEKFNLR